MMVFCGPSSAAGFGEAGLTGGMSREAGLAARSEARHSAEVHGIQSRESYGPIPHICSWAASDHIILKRRLER